jgi:hypothetical protein
MRKLKQIELQLNKACSKLIYLSRWRLHQPSPSSSKANDKAMQMKNAVLIYVGARVHSERESAKSQLLAAAVYKAHSLFRKSKARQIFEQRSPSR